MKAMKAMKALKKWHFLREKKTSNKEIISENEM